MSLPIRRSRKAKRMRIVVKWDGSAELVIPTGHEPSQYQMDALLDRYRLWLQRKGSDRLAHTKRTALLHPTIPLQIVKHRSRELVQDFLSSRPHIEKIHSIVFRSYTSQWGSCSGSGKIGFSYKLCLLPRELAHYIIAHECAHLKQMNHSRAFWFEVEQLCPNYRIHKAALKRYVP